jgi:hypothetical protein
MDNLFQNKLGERVEHPPREMLLLFVDGEVAAKEASQLEAHLAACWPCRVKTQKIQAAIADIIEFDEQVLTPRLVPPKNWRTFESQLSQLAEEESGRSSLSSKLLGLLPRVQSRLNIAGFSSALSWRVLTVPAALCLILAGLVAWLAVAPSSRVSAAEILSEAERRTAIWENQPDKVLHWGYDVTFSNHPGGLPDGKYTSLHWQDNTGGKASRLNRLYDSHGALVSAVWVRKDGSEVYFSRSRGDGIRITPTSDALLSYATRLNEQSRRALEHFVRRTDQVWQISPENDRRIKRNYTRPSLEVSVETIQTPAFGKGFRVRSVRLIGKDKSIRLEEMDDVAADSFKLFRSQQVTRYPDGKTATTESRLKVHQEASVEDFNAHDLSAELRQVKPIVQVAPEEILKIAELDEQSRTNRAEK